MWYSCTDKIRLCITKHRIHSGYLTSIKKSKHPKKCLMNRVNVDWSHWFSAGRCGERSAASWEMLWRNLPKFWRMNLHCLDPRFQSFFWCYFWCTCFRTYINPDLCLVFPGFICVHGAVVLPWWSALACASCWEHPQNQDTRGLCRLVSVMFTCTTVYEHNSTKTLLKG